MPQISFTLNGTRTEASCEPDQHFLDVLREECGITSAKDGCSPQGYCGCCTILVDGRPALACLRKAEQMDGRDVVTLDGIDPVKRETLARAFVQEGAVQCGFCTPGIAMRAYALLERDSEPTRQTIQRALSGNLCRCTGYVRIVDAVQTAAEMWSGDPIDRTDPRRSHFFGEEFGLTRMLPAAASASGVAIGTSAARYRGRDHTVGEKPYVADMRVEGMHHGAVVLSEHPRATVTGIDTSRAAAISGVKRVLTASDVPGERHVGLILKDWPIFVAVGETTRCVGDVLALVIADSLYTARRAARAVDVEYRVLDAVTNPEDALQPDAPQVHESGNRLEVCSFSRGDVDAALSAAAHVVEQSFETQRIEHAFLEPEACLAIPRPDGSLKVYSQGQGVHDDQRQIAGVLGVEIEDVEVELVTNGGAFGGKEDLSIQAQTSLAAKLLGQPVRTVLTREQSMRIHPKRHPITLHYTIGADERGVLQAVRVRILGDTGAYASVGMKVLERAAGHSCGVYHAPNVDVKATTVYTNNPPCGAMRGFGANQATFGIEGMMDLLAERVGIDGYDIRERNILRPGDPFATGQIMTESCGIRQTLEAVREVYKTSRYAGIGCGIKNTGIGNGLDDSSRVRIHATDEGRLEILTGYTEMGQGLFTVLRQVVAEETGLSPDIMDVRAVSDPAVYCGMTTASRGTALSTTAAQRAAQKLAADVADRSLVDLAGKTYDGEYVCEFTTRPGADVENPKTHMTFSYATQVVILDDDGRLDRVVAAHDVGRAINPLACAGQIEGSVHMGLGYALSEDFPCTGGRPDSLLLRDLGILKAKETPHIDVILVEVPDEVGGYGSKGIGEIGLVPTAGAVAAALHAFDGIRRFRLPMDTSPAAAPSVPKSRQKKRRGDSDRRD